MSPLEQVHITVAKEVYAHLEALVASMANSKSNTGKLLEVPAELMLGKGNVDKDITLVIDLKLYWNAKLNPNAQVNMKGPNDEN